LERIEQQLFKVGNLGWQRYVIAGAGSQMSRKPDDEPRTVDTAVVGGGVYGPFAIFGEGLMDKVWSSREHLDQLRHAFLRHGCDKIEGFWGKNSEIRMNEIDRGCVKADRVYLIQAFVNVCQLLPYQCLPFL
jgi:hypothetical protein